MGITVRRVGTTRPAPGSDGTVVGKVALVLETLADAGVAGVSELSRRTGLAKTTVHRTAKELHAVGFVERAGDGYRLGAKMFELGSRVPGRRHLRDAALPFLEDLSRATNQTVHLAVLDGVEVIYVERLVGARSSEVPSSVAARLPLHCTATGKCILAFGEPLHAARVLREPLEPLTQHSIRDTDDLRKQLDTVADRGFAEEVSEVSEGLRSLAAPIYSFGDALIGAISATGPIEDFDRDGIEPLVLLAASGLSRTLGGLS